MIKIGLNVIHISPDFSFIEGFVAGCSSESFKEFCLISTKASRPLLSVREQTKSGAQFH